jgi:Tfp pilus assembly protein PilX
VALTELAQAGRSAASGRLRAAGASLRAGESTITKATAMANSPDTAGVPGAPAREPAGQ